MDTSAEPSTQPSDDAAMLAERRLTLRAYADHIAQIVEALPLPETFLEAERAARAVTVADRLIQQLPRTHAEQNDDTDDNLVKPPRLRLRGLADQLLKVIGYIPDPDSYLMSERAGRCVLATDRMLSQLYEAPKAPKAPAFASHDDDDMDDAPEATSDEVMCDFAQTLLRRLTNMTRAHAKTCGFWPDGSRYEPDVEPDDSAYSPRDPILPRPDETNPELVARVITAHVNAMERARAQHTGHWPDGSAYDAATPDYYAISDKIDEKVLKRPATAPSEPPGYSETPGPSGFPWWLIRKTPDKASP